MAEQIDQWLVFEVDGEDIQLQRLECVFLCCRPCLLPGLRLRHVRIGMGWKQRES